MDPREDRGRWFDKELVARGGSLSPAVVVDGILECEYEDIADAALGGRSSRGFESAGFVGSGLDPPGRVGLFVRRSFR